jgi:hypothetical protein
VAELRVLHVTQKYGKPATVAGFYDGRHLPDMATDALKLTPLAKGVYLTINPLAPDILARCANRVQIAGTGDLAGDTHVVGRRWLYVDVDPVRLAGISATDAEKAAAHRVAGAVRQHLDGLGWPAPILADSGNGYHLFYPLDLPAADGGLVQRCLAALAVRFDTDAAKVDKAVHNAARIAKLPGTLARKGDPTPDRPHRRGGILEIPSEIRTTPLELLEALAAEATPTTSAYIPGTPPPPATPRPFRSAGNHRLDVARWLAARGVAFRVKAGPDAKGRTIYVLAVCPFNADHRDPDSCVMQAVNGQLSAKCLHDSCSGKSWQDFKAMIGPPDPDHFDPPLRANGKAITNGKPAARQPADEYPPDQHGDAWEGPVNGTLADPPKQDPPAGGPWDPPIELVTIPKSEPFPITVFTYPLQQYIQQGAKALNCPADYFAIPMLAIAGGCIGNLAKLPTGLGEGQHRDDYAFNFACFLVRDLALADAEAIPWLLRWDSQQAATKGETRLLEIIANARTYGQRAIGCGLQQHRRHGIPHCVISSQGRLG